MLKHLAVAAVAMMLTAETPPPATLAPYIKGERFDPGDYGWLRGNFPDATPAQKAEWRVVLTWGEQCRTEQHAQIRAALAERGVAMSDVGKGMGTGLCGSFRAAMPHDDQGSSWPAFQATLVRVRPVAQAIVWGAALAQTVADPETPDAASLLIARPVTDQVLRSALPWDKGDVPGAPPLDPAAHGIVEALVMQAASERDHANTAWLKKLVAVQGFPTVPKVGQEASHMAWLLVQHADDDPAFQLDMLRLMEPLAARGEVAKKDYAFLYDRVMLKLVGKQRYGSQFTCAQGRRVPLPLESVAMVNAFRREMNMNTVAARAVELDKTYGTCPPDVVPPAPAKR